MVTHDPRAAGRAERVLHLDKGRLVRESGPESAEMAFKKAGRVIVLDSVSRLRLGANAKPQAAVAESSPCRKPSMTT